ncbi:MAG TPA: peptide ABC transporter substrate-binding protein [Chloroflexia bacterium]|nr:peptide ABC transporter substrate-binding protein [Chloroflexia bacterium]
MPVSFRPQAIIALCGLALLAIILWTGSGAYSSVPASQSGETYVEAMVGAPRYINPLLAASDSDKDLTHLIFSGLTRVDEHGEIVPDLASGWEVSPNGQVYTFTLKPGLRWHDGQPLTADDVLFTLRLLQAPDFPGDSTLAQPWRTVAIDAPTRQTLRLTLPAPNAAFLQHTTLGILPSHLWSSVKVSEMQLSDLNLYPTGAGPWRNVARRPTLSDAPGLGEDLPGTPVPGSVPLSEGMILEPNPYHVPTAQRNVSRIWFRLYPTFGAALTGFRMGEAHGLGHIPVDSLAEVQGIEGVTLHKQALARYSMLILNARSPLLDRVETRQALYLAIDRQAIASDSAIDGTSAHGPVLPQSWAYDPTLPLHGYNPQEAQRLLDSAGWAASGPGGLRVRDGVTLTLVLAANQDVPANVVVAQKIEGYLRQVGVDVKLALVSRDRLLRDYLGPRSYHMALASWEAQGADPDVFQYWHSSQANVEGGLNFSGWANPQADEALQAARLTSDKAARKGHYATFQKVFQQEIPAVVLYTPRYTYATRPPAQGVTLPTTEMLDPSYRFDTLRYWSIQLLRIP